MRRVLRQFDSIEARRDARTVDIGIIVVPVDVAGSAGTGRSSVCAHQVPDMEYLGVFVRAFEERRTFQEIAAAGQAIE